MEGVHEMYIFVLREITCMKIMYPRVRRDLDTRKSPISHNSSPGPYDEERAEKDDVHCITKKSTKRATGLCIAQWKRAMLLVIYCQMTTSL